MAIFKNKNKYDKSNVRLKNKSIIYEKNTSSNTNFDYIDYGASYVNKKFLKKCQKIRNLIYQYYYKIYQKKIN